MPYCYVPGEHTGPTGGSLPLEEVEIEEEERRRLDQDSCIFHSLSEAMPTRSYGSFLRR